MADRDKTPAASPLVLIANDQEWSARSLESILGPNGYAVIRAYTGQQALERARTSQPDIIILDAQMPDIHGFEVCRALRSDPRFSTTTPIVITTSGPSGRTQRLEAYRAGAWEFLGQPLDGEALLLKLHTFLQAKRQSTCSAMRACSIGTGLYNMRGLARRAREIGSEAFRRHEALACIVFAPETDLPRTSRRDAEEQCSGCRAGGRHHSSARSGLRCHWTAGPTEFAVIAPATESEGAVRLMQRLGGASRPRV